MVGNPAAIAGASEEQLAHPLTAYVCGNRFNEGPLGSAFESGVLTAIVRRAEELVANVWAARRCSIP